MSREPKAWAQPDRAAPPPTHPLDVAILRTLARYCHLALKQDQVGALSAPRISRRTVGPRLQNLRVRGLVHRPFGERGGEQITQAGRQLLATIPIDDTPGASH